ncbi:MAG: hypothetical protein ACRC92_00300 [Peptostreptococcaceae bacterium]
MSSKFLDWYTQALGATLGMIACIYAYLNGFMFVYGNIDRNFDFLGFEGVLSSYFLYPLCILTLILAFIKSYIQKKDIFNIPFNSVNVTIVLLTVLFGFMGAKIYFTIPAIFIIFSIVKPYLIYKGASKTESTDLNEAKNITIDTSETLILLKPEDSSILEEGEKINDNIQLILTKRQMARELLEKKSNTEFITEITGLTLEEINSINEEINK